MRTIIALTAVALFTAAMVAAQNPNPPSQERSRTTEGVASSAIEGTVVSSTGTELVIRTRAGERMSFTVAPGTETVATGQVVRVEYEEQDNGQRRALSIEPVSNPGRRSAAEADNRSEVAARTPRAAADPQVEPAQRAREQRAAQTRNEELPRTASNVPALLVAGLLLIAAGFGVRALRLAGQKA